MTNETKRTDRIQVAILDDHQSIIDGYLYRLGPVPEIEVVLTATLSLELERKLMKQAADVLLLDVNVPISKENANPQPILQVISRLQEICPHMYIIVISMYAERTLVKALIAAGVSGYILKDDHKAIQNLGNEIIHVAADGIYFSQQIQDQLSRPVDGTPLLTPRQIEILSILSAYPDLTTAAVALKLNISPPTVRNLLSNAYLRLGVHNRSAAISLARQKGLITSLRPSIELLELQEKSDPSPNEED